MIMKAIISLAVLFSAVAAQGNETCAIGTFQAVVGNCKSFEVCVNGEWIVRQCREGLMWNKKVGYCVQIDKSCSRSCNGVAEGSSKAVANDCSAFQVCVNGKWKSKKCAPGYKWSNQHNICTVNDGSCDMCNTGQFKPISECNQNFQICRGGKWITDTCPLSMVFDIKSYFCVNSKSCEDQLTKPKPCAEGSFRSDESDCSGFEVCYETKWIKQKCIQGMRWDSEKLICIIDNGSCKHNCNSGQLQASDNSTCSSSYSICHNNKWVEVKCPLNQVFDPVKQNCVSMESCNIKQTIPCGDIPEGTFQSVEGECDAFEICLKGEWIRQSCRQGQMWNSTDLYCIPKDFKCKPCKGLVAGSLRPKADCNRNYYMCLEDGNITQSCPLGMIFDPVVLYCTKISKQCGGEEETSCGDQRQGTLRPVESKCNQYEICYRSRWLQQDCSEHFMFDPTKLKCVRNDGSCKVCAC